MMRPIFNLLICFTLIACSMEWNAEAEKRGAFSIGALDENLALLEKLKNEGVESAFIDSEGYIGIDPRDTAEFRSVKRAFLHEEDTNPDNINAEGVVNEAHLAMYEEEFNSKGVPYTVDISGSVINIKWRAEHDESVDQIVEDVRVAWLKHIVGE